MCLLTEDRLCLVCGALEGRNEASIDGKSRSEWQCWVSLRGEHWWGHNSALSVVHCSSWLLGWVQMSRRQERNLWGAKRGKGHSMCCKLMRSWVYKHEDFPGLFPPQGAYLLLIGNLEKVSWSLEIKSQILFQEKVCCRRIHTNSFMTMRVLNSENRLLWMLVNTCLSFLRGKRKRFLNGYARQDKFTCHPIGF